MLKTENARRLYGEFAADLPIVDFHNHLSVEDIARDRRFENVGELWLFSDPYKHRLMRICGVDEYYITGSSEPFEKFEKFCEVFPRFAGNPVYDWCRMELSRIFGIDLLPDGKGARYLYDLCGEKLASPEFSCRAILNRFSIAYQSPVASLLDDLSLFDGKSTAPSLRGDQLLTPTTELKKAISEKAALPIGEDLDSYIRAVSVLLDRFDEAGCRFADHALDDGFFQGDTDGHKQKILIALASEYQKRGWTLLLHLDAKRSVGPRLARLAGPAGGYAAVGGGFDLSSLGSMLGEMEGREGLPDTVLFPLNLGDMAPLSVLQGSFAQDGVASKVQLGPAWWWCDHALGIRHALSCISSFGLVSEFIGMTTDSRSILSFVRHDYFRRLLCNWLDEQNTAGEWELSFEAQGEMIRKICFENAMNHIKK